MRGCKWPEIEAKSGENDINVDYDLQYPPPTFLIFTTFYKDQQFLAFSGFLFAYFFLSVLTICKILTWKSLFSWYFDLQIIFFLPPPPHRKKTFEYDIWVYIGKKITIKSLGDSMADQDFLEINSTKIFIRRA